mgnify:CR=1 FL=1
MNIDLMLREIWFDTNHWSLGYDKVRGIYMYNALTGVAFYADNVEDVVRKVWLSIYAAPYNKPEYTVIPPSHGMVK